MAPARKICERNHPSGRLVSFRLDDESGFFCLAAPTNSMLYCCCCKENSLGWKVKKFRSVDLVGKIRRLCRRFLKFIDKCIDLR